jgi:hypothetical protein
LLNNKQNLIENHEMKMRMRLMNSQQQSLVSRVSALEALQRDVSMRQTALAASSTTTEGFLKDIRRNISRLQS